MANGNDSVFQTLRLVETGPTQWYGFRIRTSTRGARAFLEGAVPLEDHGVPLPTDPSFITAYKGVHPSFVLDAAGNAIAMDLGTVAFGNNGGEYVMTFSIEAADLQRRINDSETVPKTLTLRDPVTDQVVFNLLLEVDKMRQGQVPGVTFDDFVFEISPTDFGDAPDTGRDDQADYPTLYERNGIGLEENGARHLNSNLEWFGRFDTANAESVSSETNAADIPNRVTPGGGTDPDGVPNQRGTRVQYLDNGELVSEFLSLSPDLDRFDDGVVFYPLTYEPNGQGRADFTVCVADARSTRYANEVDRGVYVNAWFDWDTSRSWEEGSEHVIDGVRLRPIPGTAPNPHTWSVVLSHPSTTIVFLDDPSPTGNCGRFIALFDVPGQVGDGELWARFRVDYGENVSRNDPRPLFESDGTLDTNQNGGLTKGAAQFGEVEDYWIGSDFGTAPDPFTFNDPPGQYPTLRHDEPERDGARHLDITREWLGPAVTRETNGFDTHNDGIVVPEFVTPGLPITLELTVTSTIDSRGYDHPTAGPVVSWDWDPAKESQSCGQFETREYTLGTTPIFSQGKGRYNGTNTEQTLWLNAWADWNGNGIWGDEAREKVLDRVPIAPETFGLDGQYTLGEGFFADNADDVFTPGIDRFDPDIHDQAGMPSQTFKCRVTVPPDVAPTFWWRFRLDYGENGSANDGIVHHSTEVGGRQLAAEKGGALFGEVEDYVSRIATPQQVPEKRANPSGVFPGDTTHFTIIVPNTESTLQFADITDNVPVELEILPLSLACSSNARVCDVNGNQVFVMGTIDPNDRLTIDFDATVRTDPPPPQFIVNCASIFRGAGSEQACTTLTVIVGPGGGIMAVTQERTLDPLATVATLIDRVLDDLFNEDARRRMKRRTS
jgi:hypothetical protein